MPVFKVLRKLDPPIKWYIGKQKAYDNLESYDDKAIYFIYDTGLIYTRTHIFNKSIIIFKPGERPLIGANDRLYINTDTLEGFVYHENEWIQVLEGIKTATVMGLDDVESIGQINGVTLKAIVDLLMTDVLSKSVDSVEWDDSRSVLIYRLKGIGRQLPITGLINRFELDPNTRVMTSYDKDGNKTSEITIFDNHIIGGKYDDERKAIIFTMRDRSEVRLHAYALLNLFQGARTKSMTNVVHNYIDGKNVLSSRVNISIHPGNRLKINNDGLFSDTPISLDNMEQGEMYLVGGGGEFILPSHININILATEAYVQAMKDEVTNWLLSKGALWLKRADVIQSFNTKPQTSKVPSRSLFKGYFALKRMI